MQSVGTDKNHGKFQPASIAISVASRTGVSGAVRGGGGGAVDGTAGLLLATG